MYPFMLVACGTVMPVSSVLGIPLTHLSLALGVDGVFVCTAAFPSFQPSTDEVAFVCTSG